MVHGLETMKKLNDEAAGEPHSVLGPLTEELQTILGMPNFTCGPIAELFRDSGKADIPRKAEREQAFVIYWMLGLYSKHGSRWRDWGSKELAEMMKVIEEKPKQRLEEFVAEYYRVPVESVEILAVRRAKGEA